MCVSSDLSNIFHKINIFVPVLENREKTEKDGKNGALVLKRTIIQAYTATKQVGMISDLLTTVSVSEAAVVAGSALQGIFTVAQSFCVHVAGGAAVMLYPHHITVVFSMNFLVPSKLTVREYLPKKCPDF